MMIPSGDLLRGGYKVCADFEQGKVSRVFRYFTSRVESSHNVVFRDERVLNELFQAMGDQFRRMGKPDSISQIFERRITSRYRGVFQSNMHIERM